MDNDSYEYYAKFVKTIGLAKYDNLYEFDSYLNDSKMFENFNFLEIAKEVNNIIYNRDFTST